MILDRKRPENECSERSLPKKKGREGDDGTDFSCLPAGLLTKSSIEPGVARVIQLSINGLSLRWREWVRRCLFAVRIAMAIGWAGEK